MGKKWIGRVRLLAEVPSTSIEYSEFYKIPKKLDPRGSLEPLVLGPWTTVYTYPPPRQSAVTAPTNILMYAPTKTCLEWFVGSCSRDSNSLVCLIWCSTIHNFLPRTSGKFKGKFQYLKQLTRLYSYSFS